MKTSGTPGHCWVFALLILVMHWIDLVWLVVPARLDAASPRIPWIEIGLSVVTLCWRGRDLGCRFPGAVEEAATGAAQRSELARDRLNTRETEARGRRTTAGPTAG